MVCVVVISVCSGLWTQFLTCFILCHLAHIPVSCLLCFSCLLQAFILDHQFYLGVDYMYLRYERFQFAAASYKPTVRVCLRTHSSRSKPYLYQGWGTVCFGPFSSSASSRGSRGDVSGCPPPSKRASLDSLKLQIIVALWCTQKMLPVDFVYVDYVHIFFIFFFYVTSQQAMMNNT